MNIAFFSNQFASAGGHGIAHYAQRLYEGLHAFEDINVLPVATGCDKAPDERRRFEKATGLRVIPWGRKLTPLSWIFMKNPPVEWWMDAPIDVTHNLAPGFPVATRRKLVVTVHDMGPITHPEYFLQKGGWSFRKGIEQAVRQADAIICVSQATADELVGVAGESVGKRIEVIHEGVDAVNFALAGADVSEMLEQHLPNGEPYILSVGAISPRKNLVRVLRAFQRIAGKIPHHLMLTGGSGWEAGEVMELMHNPDMSPRLHSMGYVSDMQLKSLYQNAALYVHPSLFEGFGLTVLEAMAAGCPVVTSNKSSLAEVAGDAALLVNPESVDEIADAILALAMDESKRDVYIQLGHQRVKQFRWSDTARKVAQVYRTV